MTTKNFPPVSIIVPVRNEEATVEKLLNSIFNLDYPDYEVIIIDDGSRDRTSEVLQKFQGRIKVIRTDGIGPSAARNLGIKEAKGEFIAFTDGDCLVDKNWLKELISGFNGEEIAGVGGDQLSPEDDIAFAKLINRFMKAIGFVTEYVKQSTGEELQETEHNPTCNVMYKKEIFAKVGYFSEGLWPGEDVELDYRIKKAGYRLLFNPRAVVYHYRPRNLKKFVLMMYKYGLVQALLFKRHGLFRRMQFIPVITLLGIFFLLDLKKQNTYSGTLFLFCLFLFFWFYFYIRTKRFFEAIKFLGLFFLTVVFWHIGFGVGLVKK